ncbi:MAG TPA: DUF3343 domain-containing protein [Anaerolineae bacterium]|nr:DUF3343 domain-containing protein [Anaerolineae bacterium]
MPEYSVVLFHSTAHAIRAEKVLQRSGFRPKMIPTPRQLSSDCGMALRFNRADEERVKAILKENKVPVNGIHAI